MSGGEQPDTSGQGISDGSSVSLKPLMCLHHYSGGQRINLKNLLLILGRTGSLIVAQSFPIIPSKPRRL